MKAQLAPMIIRLLKRLLIAASLALILALGAAAAAVALFYHYGRGLPDYHQLADYEPPVATRVLAGDGRLLAEYATERRVYVPFEAIPRRVVQAFLSAEDKNFYSHPGVDVASILRASLQNLVHLGDNRRPVGASTITQQVAKNFLLTNEVSLSRKIKEAILAIRIENTFTKDHILELYLNEIYLGGGSYGVAAAALNYFDKPLDQLTVAEAAFLAALPKAPNNYNPSRFPEAAKSRRDWVIDRMVEDGYLSGTEGAAAKNEPLVTRKSGAPEFANAGYFSEEVRRELVDRFGEKALTRAGSPCARPSIRHSKAMPIRRSATALSPTTAATAGAGRWASSSSRPARRMTPGRHRLPPSSVPSGSANGSSRWYSRSMRRRQRSGSASASTGASPSTSSNGRARAARRARRSPAASSGGRARARRRDCGRGGREGGRRQALSRGQLCLAPTAGAERRHRRARSPYRPCLGDEQGAISSSAPATSTTAPFRPSASPAPLSSRSSI